MKLKSISLLLLLAALILLVAACGGGINESNIEATVEARVEEQLAAKPTPIPTSTLIPPTATPTAMPTQVPPTATPTPTPTPTIIPSPTDLQKLLLAGAAWITSGETKSGTIDVKTYDYDTWLFNGITGQRATMSLSGNDSWTPKFSFLDPEGEVITKYSTLVTRHPLLQTGTYRIVVQSWGFWIDTSIPYSYTLSLTIQ